MSGACDVTTPQKIYSCLHENQIRIDKECILSLNHFHQFVQT